MGLGEAAQALGVSIDTLRRWDRAGKIRTIRDERNRRLVPAAEVERLTDEDEDTLSGLEAIPAVDTMVVPSDQADRIAAAVAEGHQRRGSSVLRALLLLLVLALLVAGALLLWYLLYGS